MLPDVKRTVNENGIPLRNDGCGFSVETICRGREDGFFYLKKTKKDRIIL